MGNNATFSFIKMSVTSVGFFKNIFKILILLFILNLKNVENTKVIFGTEHMTVSGSTLNNISDTDSIYVIEYNIEEPQITRIENFPNLELVVIQDLKQKIMVTFNNVPKFRRMNLSKNDINYIAANMFGNTDLESMWLFGNEISIIEDKSFGNNVKVVSLYCNKIQAFRPEWFKNPSIVTILDLNGNRIRHIRKNAFRKFTSMDRIDLSFNGLKTIESNAFSARTSFNHVLLAHNDLTELKSNVFKNDLLNFNYFDIRYNSLTFLPESLLDRLTVKKTPVIDGNPWQCPCYDKYIKNWINWTTYGEDKFNPKDRHGEPRCVKAIGSFTDTCVDFVSEELISFYRDNTSPPLSNRDKYCSCLKNRKQGVGDWDCYFAEDFKFLTLPDS